MAKTSERIVGRAVCEHCGAYHDCIKRETRQIICYVYRCPKRRGMTVMQYGKGVEIEMKHNGMKRAKETTP